MDFRLGVTILIIFSALVDAKPSQEMEDEPFNFRAWNEKRAGISKSDDWIILQQRKFLDGDTDQFQVNTWENYKNGFGALNETAYWMGLEKMHQMTSSGTWQLSIVVKSNFDGFTYNYLIYDDFKIENEMLGYNLHIGSERQTYGLFEVDNIHLTYSNGCPFSTKDRDNDRKDIQCARNYGGGWWFKSCHQICLNCKKQPVGGSEVVTETHMGMRRV